MNTEQFSHLKYCLWTSGKIDDPLCTFRTNFHGFFYFTPESTYTDNVFNIWLNCFVLIVDLEVSGAQNLCRNQKLSFVNEQSD
jgi:hypothetical protein